MMPGLGASTLRTSGLMRSTPPAFWWTISGRIGPESSTRTRGGFVEAGVAGEQDAHAVGVVHDAGLDGRHVLDGGGGVEQLGALLEADDGFEVLDRREDHVELACL